MPRMPKEGEIRLKPTQLSIDWQGRLFTRMGYGLDARRHYADLSDHRTAELQKDLREILLDQGAISGGRFWLRMNGDINRRRVTYVNIDFQPKFLRPIGLDDPWTDVDTKAFLGEFK